MMALLNNWDLKKENNAIYFENGERHFVVSDVGALGETVKHGVTGLVVPPNDPRALGCAMAELFSNREMVRRMGAEGRKLISGELSWEKNIGEVERAYSHAIASRQRSLSA